jgi:hypothetical protein
VGTLRSPDRPLKRARGETRQEAIDLAWRLNTQGLVPLLGYSKESSDSISEIQATEDEVISCIHDLKAFPKPAFVAIKLSGLSPSAELRRLERDVSDLIFSLPSDSSRLTASQIGTLRTRYPELFNRLNRISRAASDSGVFLIVDAEIRYLDNIDSLPTSSILCSILNSNKSHIWNTHQMFVPHLNNTN